MNHLKSILTFTFLAFAFFSCSQTISSKDYKILAKFISSEGSDKISFAKFKVIKDFSDSLSSNDTIIVGYYNNKQPEKNIDSVVLIINKYNGKSNMKNYFVCPDYDGENYIQKANIEYVSFAYWEGCETGRGDCKPLVFTRPKNKKNWVLMMPCGGTGTSITIMGYNYKKELHLSGNQCSPCIDLFNMSDGKYVANMTSCGLGGAITFNLITQ